MPASAAAIPPWIAQPADPAAHYAQGYQIGVHVGAQQAAQAFQAQQLALEQHKQLMQQQQQAYEDQMNTQVLNMKAAETARRFQANQEFRARVGAGENPASVLMQLAPDLGESPTSILHQQATREMAQANLGLRQQNLQRLKAADTARATPKPTAAERERSDLTTLQRQSSDLENQLKSDPNNTALKSQLQDVQNQIQTWYTQHPGGQQISLTTDAQGNVQVQMGTGKIQPGAQSAVQKELADLKNSVVQVDRARNVLTEKDVGVAGTVWDELVNKWVSQVAQEAGDPSVSANRVQLQKAVDSYLQTQTAKGRLSSAERNEIRDALVTRKPGESIGRARGVLDAMSRIQKFDAITKAKSINMPLEPWMFQDMSQTEIKQLLTEKILTPAEALNWASKATRR